MRYPSNVLFCNSFGAIIFISTYSESDTVSMLLMILLLIFLEGMVTVWMFECLFCFIKEGKL